MSQRNVMLPFAALPTTECVRNACANIIRDIQRDHDLTDMQLAEQIGVHVNTIERTRNKKSTMDNLTLARIQAVFGQEVLGPWFALGLCDRPETEASPITPMALATAAISSASGPKAQFDALPAARDARDALDGWIGAVERKRLRSVA